MYYTGFMWNLKSSVAMRVAILTVPLFSSGVSAGDPAVPSKEARTIVWTVAHSRGEPEYDALMNEFARRIEVKSGGKLKMKFIDSDASEDTVSAAVYDQVLTGGTDMSQLDTRGLHLDGVQLPFVFRSHEHAAAVFDGPVGKKLLDSVYDSSEQKIRGFAFTLSGGYRILLGKVPLRRVADFKNLRIMRGSPVLAAFMEELGASTVREDPENGQYLSGKIDLFEAELSRVGSSMRQYPEIWKKVKFVNLTHHTLLTTVIVANAKFFASLTDDQQRLLGDEVQRLAASERNLSVDLEKRNLELLSKKGMEIVALPDAERPAFVKAGEAVGREFPALAGLLNEIRAVKEKSALAGLK